MAKLNTEKTLNALSKVSIDEQMAFFETVKKTVKDNLTKEVERLKAENENLQTQIENLNG
jgi:cell division protein FtsB